jgi:lysophospholipase L1-like esterase
MVLEEQAETTNRAPSAPKRMNMIRLIAAAIALVTATAAYAGTERILFVGNSITLHGAKASIGWTNTCGMAASAPEKDYVHIVTRAVGTTTGTAPVTMVQNIADFERRYETYDLAQLKKALDFKADTIIVAIGENVPAIASEEAKAKFKASVLKLLKAMKGSNNPTIIVRSSFWQNKAKDEILKQACQEAGGVFVDISGLSKDESHFARSERSYAHSGVAAHPGDKGMQAIADALLAALKSTKALSN